MIVVSDATPLIALAAVHRLDVLPALYGEVVVPDAVYEEVVVRGAGEPGADEVRAASWIRRETVPPPSPELLEEIDRGEAEAITLALSRRADRVLMDERRGRRVAEAHGLSVTGTLGVLIEATRRGLVPDLATLLESLREVGFYLGDDLIERALRAVRGREGPLD